MLNAKSLLKFSSKNQFYLRSASLSNVAHIRSPDICNTHKTIFKLKNQFIILTFNSNPALLLYVKQFLLLLLSMSGSLIYDSKSKI